MQNKPLSQRLTTTVENAYQRLSSELNNQSSSQVPAPGKWSPKQIIGHLIDSASNNHQRFVRGNFQDNLVFPGYQQEEWVKLHAYQEMDWDELLNLWRSFNLLIARVMHKTPDTVKQYPHEVHSLDRIAWKRISGNQAGTLGYFMKDYIDHLEHHIRQILADF